MLRLVPGVHDPNGISIDSAVFAQLMAERPGTLQWAALPPQNCPIPRYSIGNSRPHLRAVGLRSTAMWPKPSATELI